MATRTIEGTEVPVAGTWNIDPTHTVAGFVAKHLMVTKVRGRFTDVSGSFVVAERPEDSSVEVTIQAGSITTGTEDRDTHLKSPDFLDVEQFPTLAFTSNRVEADGDDWHVHGDLTIRDVTKPVTLEVEFEGAATDPWGNTKAAFTASTEIDREDWGLNWNVPLESGGWLVGRKVKIEIDVQAALAA